MADAPVQTEINPLLFIAFCPHCIASGIFALAAAGVVSLPAIFGVPFEYYLAPAIIVGAFLTWIAWGRWERRKECAAAGADPASPARANPAGPYVEP